MLKEMFLQLLVEPEFRYVGFNSNGEQGRYYFILNSNQITVTASSPFKYDKDTLYLLVLREIVTVTYISIC